MNHPPKKPKMFIGSSREAIKYAEAVHANMRRDVQTLPWYDGTFSGNQYTMEALEKRLDECDYAVFIFAADDLVKTRGKYVFITRDNTIFEMGLFWGKLRRKRVFCLIPLEVGVNNEDIQGIEINKLHILSDLSGLSLLEYEHAHGNEFQAAVSVSCAEIRKAIEAEATPFFPNFADKARRNANIAQLFWEYFRQVPITSNEPLPVKYNALYESIRQSFFVPPHLAVRVSHITLYSKEGTDGMRYAAGNMDHDAFYPFQHAGSSVEQNIVIRVLLSEKWSFAHDYQVESVSLLCYPLGKDHVISIHFSGDLVLEKDAMELIINLNDDLLRTITRVVGGNSK